MFRVLLATTFVVFAMLSLVTDASEFERVLLPTAPTGEEIPGALGSRWTTTLAVVNTAAEYVSFLGYTVYPHGCGIATCPPIPTLIPPDITFFPLVPTLNPPGGILKVEKDNASQIHFDLRIRDVSRQAETWGTQVPVVRASTLGPGAVELIDIPLTDGFRTALRIYDLSGSADAQVLVRYFEIDSQLRSPWDPFHPGRPDGLLAEELVTLHVARYSDPDYDFGYAELPNLAARTGLHGAGRVRVRLEPVTPGLRLWGLASVTNNDTQHVTLVAPQ